MTKEPAITNGKVNRKQMKKSTNTTTTRLQQYKTVNGGKKRGRSSRMLLQRCLDHNRFKRNEGPQ